jgi:hypothetical protein
MKKFISVIATTSLLLSVSVTVFGAEKMKPMDKGVTMETTIEQRQKMAMMHENMATCLRSDKPMDDCKKEMMKSCEDSMGKECKMMHEMHGMNGHKIKHHEVKEDEKSDN